MEDKTVNFIACLVLVVANSISFCEAIQGSLPAAICFATLSICLVFGKALKDGE
jgi:hypothetical protein